ncbi:MAG: hypothetical protein K8T20_04465 [Planctomycetes bacterium]|nr:hypothetical protein [Planctomycetota bacterium]
MPELTDEEFFALMGIAPKHQDLESLESVPPEVPELPALVNADGTRYPARRNAPNELRPVSMPRTDKQSPQVAR